METGRRSSGEMSIDCGLGGVRAAGSMDIQERQASPNNHPLHLHHDSGRTKRVPTYYLQGRYLERLMVTQDYGRRRVNGRNETAHPIFHFVPGTCLAPQSGRHLTLIPSLQQPGTGKRAKNKSITNSQERPVCRCSGAVHPNPE